MGIDTDPNLVTARVTQRPNASAVYLHPYYRLAIY
jgi:hypothetical protein